jgi:hypothetical protein
MGTAEDQVHRIAILYSEKPSMARGLHRIADSKERSKSKATSLPHQFAVTIAVLEGFFDAIWG